jgi:hypothetical protein
VPLACAGLFLEGNIDALDTRNSHGLDQFCAMLQERPGMRILDMAGASQQTVTFITGLGHQLYSGDLLGTIDRMFGTEEPYERQTSRDLADQFLECALDFPVDHFDGVLLWDNLQFLEAALLDRFIARLRNVVRPGSTLLALFHGEDKAGTVPSYSYRIGDSRTILLNPRGRRKPAQYFNNRGLERLFESFESVKFFLSRDALREVIVKR